MKNQQNKKNSYCEGCGCTPCDCGWGTEELHKNHTDHGNQKTNKDKSG